MSADTARNTGCHPCHKTLTTNTLEASLAAVFNQETPQLTSVSNLGDNLDVSLVRSDLDVFQKAQQSLEQGN